MKIAIITIAICEVIRLIQNTIQLRVMTSHNTDKYIKEATEAFVENLSKTDKDFLDEMIKRVEEDDLK